VNVKRAFHASMVALSIGMSGAWPTGIATATATPSGPLGNGAPTPVGEPAAAR
jgi:hypothetical protein